MAILRCWPRLQWFSMDRIKGNLKHQAVSVISNTIMRTMGSRDSARLVIERSRVWIPAGAVGEFSSPWSTFCADFYFGICSSPVLPQLHVKDPGHSAKSAGGRLQLNMHAPYICGFAWSNMVHGCTVYTECTKMAAISCGTSYARTVTDCKYTTSVDIQKCATKTCYKKLFTHAESHASAVSLLESGE